MVGAIVNNNIVPLNYELQNNDIVKINKSRMLEKSPGKKPLRIKPIDTSGRIIAITLIEVTVLVGILLGVLAIAK